MHELMFQAGVKGMSERSELIPCNIIKRERESILLHYRMYCTIHSSMYIISVYVRSINISKLRS